MWNSPARDDSPPSISVNNGVRTFVLDAMANRSSPSRLDELARLPRTSMPGGGAPGAAAPGSRGRSPVPRPAGAGPRERTHAESLPSSRDSSPVRRHSLLTSSRESSPARRHDLSEGGRDDSPVRKGCAGSGRDANPVRHLSRTLSPQSVDGRRVEPSRSLLSVRDFDPPENRLLGEGPQPDAKGHPGRRRLSSSHPLGVLLHFFRSWLSGYAPEDQRALLLSCLGSVLFFLLLMHNAHHKATESHVSVSLEGLEHLGDECVAMKTLPYKPANPITGRFQTSGLHFFVFIDAFRLSRWEFGVLGLTAADLRTDDPGWDFSDICLWVSFEGPRGISGNLEIHRSEDGIGRRYATVLLRCQLKEDTPKAAGGALFVNIQGEEALVYKEQPGLRQMLPPNPLPRRLTHCSTLVRNKLQPSRVLHHLQYLRAFGVQNFILYDGGGLDMELFDALEPFRRVGILEIVTMKGVLGYDTVHETLAFSHCALRTRFSSQWTMATSYEEYPHFGEEQKLTKLLSEHAGRPWMSFGVFDFNTESCLPVTDKDEWPIQRAIFWWPLPFCEPGLSGQPPLSAAGIRELRRSQRIAREKAARAAKKRMGNARGASLEGKKLRQGEGNGSVASEGNRQESGRSSSANGTVEGISDSTTSSGGGTGPGNDSSYSEQGTGRYDSEAQSEEMPDLTTDDGDSALATGTEDSTAASRRLLSVLEASSHPLGRALLAGGISSQNLSTLERPPPTLDPTTCPGKAGNRRFVFDPRLTMLLHPHEVQEPRSGGVDLPTPVMHLYRFKELTDPASLICEYHMMKGTKPKTWAKNNKFSKLIKVMRAAGQISLPAA